MSFNFVASVQPVANLTAVGGVQSVLLTWENPADYSRVEVWAHTVEDFATATKLGSTTDVKFIDEDLTATVERFYWVRVVRTYSDADTKYSTLVSASAVPTGASVGPAAIQTLHLAEESVTAYMGYEETAEVWSHIGTAPDGTVITDPAQMSYDFADLVFPMDSDGLMILTATIESKAAPVYFRGAGMVEAWVSAEVLDVTDPANLISLGYYETPVATTVAEQMPINTAQWFTSGHLRDFRHDFFLWTEAGHEYGLEMRQWVTTNNNDNFIEYTSKNRQTFAQVFKR